MSLWHKNPHAYFAVRSKLQREGKWNLGNKQPAQKSSPTGSKRTADTEVDDLWSDDDLGELLAASPSQILQQSHISHGDEPGTSGLQQVAEGEWYVIDTVKPRRTTVNTSDDNNISAGDTAPGKNEKRSSENSSASYAYVWARATSHGNIDQHIRQISMLLLYQSIDLSNR